MKDEKERNGRYFSSLFHKWSPCGQRYTSTTRNWRPIDIPCLMLDLWNATMRMTYILDPRNRPEWRGEESTFFPPGKMSMKLLGWARDTIERMIWRVNIIYYKLDWKVEKVSSLIWDTVVSGDDGNGRYVGHWHVEHGKVLNQRHPSVIDRRRCCNGSYVKGIFCCG